MKTNSEILQELQELAPVLASIPKVNAFKVPDGYFEEGIPEAAIAGIAEDKLYPLKKVNPFLAPEDAFETDASYMGIMAEILIEPYLELKDKPAFKVPQNYFEELPESILAAVNPAAEPELSESISKQQFKVPKGYFNQLSDNILNKIKAAEEESLNPLLEQMRHEEIFTVPEGYFENLSDEILRKAKGEDEEAIIRQLEPMLEEAGVSRFSLSRVLSIAAVFAVLLFGLWFVQPAANPAQSQTFEDQLAALSDDDILEYLDDHSYEFDQYEIAEASKLNGNILDGVELNEDEIDYYLNSIDFELINELYNEDEYNI